jgi:Protein of unknown function (DUF5818)
VIFLILPIFLEEFSMKKVTALLILVFALSTMSLLAADWTGYIADEKCAAKRGEDAGHAGCAKKCIDGGSAAVLASEGKVFKLDKQDEAKKLAGEKVVVKGTASEDGTMIKVDSITKAAS